MIKAAFFDIDGTLLSFATHRVSEGTIHAFDLLRRLGVRTFLSTGRPEILIPPMPITFDAAITMNGGLVYTLCNAPREILLSNPIPSLDYQRLLQVAKKEHLCIMVFDHKNMFVANPNDTAHAIQRQLDMPMPPVVELDSLTSLTAFQVIVFTTADSDEAMGHLLPGCRMPRWHALFTDVVADGNSKASGMEVICRHFGIQQDETIAFGDGGNDIEMLEWAGIGIAMGNASDEVKKHANLITTDVDHEGIEQAIKQLFA